MKYQGVLFDLDGTLLDTLQDIADATNQALSHMGFPQHEPEAYKYFIGDGREVLAIRALPEHHRDAVTVSQLVARINEVYSQHWADHTRPYPGIPALLDNLTTKNIKMAILSNKAHDLTDVMASKMLSPWHFDVVVGASSSVPKKPDPTAAIQIAHRLGLRPAEIIYLGDSGIDMNTANQAGMYPVGALWGFRTVDELLASGAKAVIEHPGDLLRIL
jgi:phosphoglycolate phosphatase